MQQHARRFTLAALCALVCGCLVAAVASITTHTKLSQTKAFATIVCATTKPFFTILAGKTGTVTAPVRPACMTLLTKAKHHTITGKLQSNPQTLQKAAIEIVRLKLG